MNKVCIAILSSHNENKLKVSDLALILFSSFSVIYQKNGGGGGETAKPYCDCIQMHDFRDSKLSSINKCQIKFFIFSKGVRCEKKTSYLEIEFNRDVKSLSSQTSSSNHSSNISSINSIRSFGWWYENIRQELEA